MHPVEIKDSEEIKVSDVVFKDILSETTRKIRRNLLLVSFITLFVVLDEVVIKSFMGVGLSQSVTPDKLTPIIESALSILILYLALSFFVYARVDHQQWNTAKDLTKVISSYQLLADIDSKINDIRYRISLYENRESPEDNIHSPNFDPRLENDKNSLTKLIKDFFYIEINGKNVIKEDVKRLKITQDDINIIFSHYTTLKSDHKFKYWLVDIVIPTLLAAIAFLKVWPGLLIFWDNL